MSLMPVVIPGRPLSTFAGGNQSEADLLTLLRDMAAYKAMPTPAAGGTLTLNSQALGSYDYVIKRGNQTVTSFTAGDWFTTTEDSRSALIVVVGNLTIDAAVVFKPSVRKLFTALYVTGDLVIDGEISMSQRGANHSAGGGNVTAQEIRLATGTFDAVANPNVPAAGGAAGEQVTGASAGTSTAGNPGSAGTDGATGGGGSGGRRSGTANTSTGGAGAAGTAFSGGSAGGGALASGANAVGAAGGAAGAAGGAADVEGGNVGAGGGAGNPGGAAATLGTGTGEAGDNGTGGVLAIFVEGDLSGSGDITCAGADGGGSNGCGGGASGGGSNNIMCGTDSFAGTQTASGGLGGIGTQANGGNGGDGTARILPIIPD